MFQQLTVLVVTSSRESKFYFAIPFPGTFVRDVTVQNAASRKGKSTRIGATLRTKKRGCFPVVARRVSQVWQCKLPRPRNPTNGLFRSSSPGSLIGALHDLRFSSAQRSCRRSMYGKGEVSFFLTSRGLGLALTFFVGERENTLSKNRGCL